MGEKRNTFFPLEIRIKSVKKKILYFPRKYLVYGYYPPFLFISRAVKQKEKKNLFVKIAKFIKILDRFRAQAIVS